MSVSADCSCQKPARVGYLLRMYPRFSQTFLVNEICELERRGLDVSIVSLRLPNEGLFHDSVCRVRARAHYLPETHHGRRWRIARRQWQIFRQSPRTYGRAARIVRMDAQAQWFDLARAGYLLSWAKKNRIDHIHVHFGTSEATVALLAWQLGGLPYSLTLHAFDIFRDNVDRPLLARKINESRFTITVSEFNRRFMVDNLPGVAPDRIRVLYNGIDLDRFRSGAEPREPLTIFGLGRLKEKKGFIHLVRAVDRLHREGLDVTCRIAGDGEERGRLKREIDRAGLKSRVELLGEVGEPRVRELMRRSGCFVLPCIQAKDGNVDALPTVLLEALAAGCPAVSTRLSGVPEIIEDGVSGLLVEPGNDEALARAIQSILSNPQRAASLSLAGRRRAEERFDIRRNVEVMHGWLGAAAVQARGDLHPTTADETAHAASSASPVAAEAP